MEAGDVWWDADLFTGNPDWAKLLAVPPAELTDEEQAFLDGPVDDSARMLDDWRINWEWRTCRPKSGTSSRRTILRHDHPEGAWRLGFSAYAHSEVIRKLSTRSLTAAVTAMVPNSLGPGELLIRFGTKAQRDALAAAAGRRPGIPCFGLTSPEAGSDAAAMTDLA